MRSGCGDDPLGPERLRRPGLRPSRRSRSVPLSPNRNQSARHHDPESAQDHLGGRVRGGVQRIQHAHHVRQNLPCDPRPRDPVDFGTRQPNLDLDLVRDAYFTSPLSPGDRSHPVTADDVVYSFQLQSATKGSILHSYTTAITSVTKTGAYQVQIVTNGPFAGMYSAASAIPILPQYIWSTYAKPLNAPIKYPVGSGAMYYDYTNTTTTTLVLRKNPNYYGLQYYCQESRPDEVRFISYSGSTTMVNDFL